MADNTKQQKLTEDELNSIKSLRQSNEQLIVELGRIEVSKRQIKERERNADEAFETLKNKEKELYDELGKKYQNGSIDVENGVFTPAAGSTERQEDDSAKTIFDEPVVK